MRPNYSEGGCTDINLIQNLIIKTYRLLKNFSNRYDELAYYILLCVSSILYHVNKFNLCNYEIEKLLIEFHNSNKFPKSEYLTDFILNLLLLLLMGRNMRLGIFHGNSFDDCWDWVLAKVLGAGDGKNENYNSMLSFPLIMMFNDHLDSCGISKSTFLNYCKKVELDEYLCKNMNLMRLHAEAYQHITERINILEPCINEEELECLYRYQKNILSKLNCILPNINNKDGLNLITYCFDIYLPVFFNKDPFKTIWSTVSTKDDSRTESIDWNICKKHLKDMLFHLNNTFLLTEKRELEGLKYVIFRHLTDFLKNLETLGLEEILEESFKDLYGFNKSFLIFRNR